jgi:hypothetical protein
MAKKKPTKKPLRTAVPMPAPIKRKFVYKSSITGKDVRAEYAKDNPDTTFRQSVDEPPKKKT